MRELLVVVLELHAERVSAALAEVDRPGEVVREVVVERGRDLPADTAAALAGLAAHDLAPRLLALAVVVGDDVPDDDAGALLAALTDGDELGEGWPLPAALPVRAGSAAAWASAGGGAAVRPLVAGAVVAAARSVGAHAHLPHP